MPQITQPRRRGTGLSQTSTKRTMGTGLKCRVKAAFTAPPKKITAKSRASSRASWCMTSEAENVGNRTLQSQPRQERRITISLTPTFPSPVLTERSGPGGAVLFCFATPRVRVQSTRRVPQVLVQDTASWLRFFRHLQNFCGSRVFA